MRTSLTRAFVFTAAVQAACVVHGAELIMVERSGCSWCARWDKDVAPIYDKSDEAIRAPLRRVSLDKGQPPFRLKEPVRFTPTFILIEHDQEVGRITGYLDDAMFWGLLGALLNRLDKTPQGN